MTGVSQRTDGMSADGLVTGEAVPVDLRIAQLPSRMLAFFVDAIVQIGLLVAAIFAITSLVGSVDSAYVVGLVLLAVIACLIGYPVLWETLSHGRSLGKLAMGLRVVRDDGGAARFRHALGRGLVGFVEIWMLEGVPALLCSLFNGRGKRFGDLLAGTVLVRERIPRPASGPPIRVDPALVPWVSTADLSRVPDSLALAMRQFLTRCRTLTNEARGQLGRRLLADVWPYLAPAPPPAHPEDVIAAIVAERRRREELRLGARPAGSTYVAPPTTAQAPVPLAAAPPPAAERPEGGFQLPR
jgi:uncharacterized RDD family membrane protein YckC